MRRPWFEAMPAIAVAAAPVAPTSSEAEATGQAETGARYCRIRDPEDPADKPIIFGDVRALANSLHSARSGRPIQLADLPLSFVGDGSGPRQGVGVWTLDPFTHDRRGYLGWAYLDGRDRRALEAALRAAQPPALERRAS